MTNEKNTALYTGMTNNLERQVQESKVKLNSGFTQRFNCTKLVYFEKYYSALEAINREKQFRASSRKKKNELVHSINLKWKYLSTDWN